MNDTLQKSPMEELLEIMRRLRAPGGCPWDREQTLDTLKPFLIEECYETIDALDSGDPARHEEELGDILLQVVFQAQLRTEAGQFGFDDVVRRLCGKLIRRHPHVFAESQVADSADVLRNWEKIKAVEKQGERKSAVDGVPRHLPALMKAHQVQTRAARVGFDWSAMHDVLAKIDEELAEVKAALASGNREHVAEEIGDLLFSVVNLSRFQKLQAEELLTATVTKFVRRFHAVERRLQDRSRRLEDCSLAEMDAEWNAVKAQERESRR